MNILPPLYLQKISHSPSERSALSRECDILLRLSSKSLCPHICQLAIPPLRMHHVQEIVLSIRTFPKTLHEILPVSIPHLQVLIRQVILALHHLQTHQIIHTDITTHALWLNIDHTQIILGEFQNACCADHSLSTSFSERARVIYNLAPEALFAAHFATNNHDFSISFSMDIWAFGVTCIQALRNIPLFPLQDQEYTLMHIARRQRDVLQQNYPSDFIAALTVQARMLCEDDVCFKTPSCTWTWFQHGITHSRKDLRDACRSFLSSMLVIHPKLRPTLAILASHDFIKTDLSDTQTSLAPIAPYTPPPSFHAFPKSCHSFCYQGTFVTWAHKTSHADCLRRLCRQEWFLRHLLQDSPLFVKSFGFYVDSMDYVFFPYLSAIDYRTLSMYTKAQFHDKDVHYITKQLIDALTYLKTLHLIHTRIHPRCIFLSSTYQIQIGGFGHAFFEPQKSYPPEPLISESYDLYIAPEIHKGEICSYEADIWSVGHILRCNFPLPADETQSYHFMNLMLRMCKDQDRISVEQAQEHTYTTYDPLWNELLNIILNEEL